MNHDTNEAVVGNAFLFNISCSARIKTFLFILFRQKYSIMDIFFFHICSSAPLLWLEVDLSWLFNVSILNFLLKFTWGQFSCFNQKDAPLCLNISLDCVEGWWLPSAQPGRAGEIISHRWLGNIWEFYRRSWSVWNMCTDHLRLLPSWRTLGQEEGWWTNEVTS